jgi:hypothetical protein
MIKGKCPECIQGYAEPMCPEMVEMLEVGIKSIAPKVSMSYGFRFRLQYGGIAQVRRFCLIGRR